MAQVFKSPAFFVLLAIGLLNSGGSMWSADEAGFAMPIKIGDRAHLTLVTPVTTEWKTMPWTADPDTLEVPHDSYYVGEKTVNSIGND